MSIIVPILVAGYFVIAFRWVFDGPVFFGKTYQEYEKISGKEYD